jgi:hypothetical protein
LCQAPEGLLKFHDALRVTDTDNLCTRH